MSGMKKIIDKWVVDNYERILLLSRARTKQMNRNYDGDIIVSYCYEYLINNIEKVTEENIESIAFNFINMSTYWTNSAVNRIEMQTQSPFRYTIEFESYMLDKEDETIEDKIQLEKWLSSCKYIIAVYKEQIKHDKVKTRFLEVILSRKKITVKALAEHFNISEAGAWIRAKEIKMEIRKLRKNNING